MSKITVSITFDRQEIIDNLPYALICDVVHGHMWTTRERKAFEQLFIGEEKEIADKIVKQSYKWRIKTGVPDSITITAQEYKIWMILADFCSR